MASPVIRVKPQFRNVGASWGLEHPVVYGRIIGVGWAAWDRHTGEVKFVSEAKNPVIAEIQAREFSMPQNYGQNPFIYDEIA